MNLKICKKCCEALPENSECFNLLPSGNYRGTCKSCMAENTRRHYYKDKQKVQDRVNKYKEMKSLADGRYTELDIARMRLSQKDRCFYCDYPLLMKGEVDHVIPVSRGGSNWPRNLVLACQTCNRDKHNKTHIEFYIWRYDRKLNISQRYSSKIINETLG